MCVGFSSELVGSVSQVSPCWWCYDDLGFALVWMEGVVGGLRHRFYIVCFLSGLLGRWVSHLSWRSTPCHFVIRSEYRVITRLKNMSFAHLNEKDTSFWSQVRSLLLDSFCPIFCFLWLFFVFTFLPMRLISFSSLIGSMNFPVKKITKYHLRSPVWSAHFVEMTGSREVTWTLSKRRLPENLKNWKSVL